MVRYTIGAVHKLSMSHLLDAIMQTLDLALITRAQHELAQKTYTEFASVAAQLSDLARAFGKDCAVALSEPPKDATSAEAFARTNTLFAQNHARAVLHYARAATKATVEGAQRSLQAAEDCQHQIAAHCQERYPELNAFATLIEPATQAVAASSKLVFGAWLSMATGGQERAAR